MYNVYMLYDRVAANYGSLWVSINDSTACREFPLRMKDNPYADDFDLFAVGTFNPESGEFAYDKRFVCAFAAVKPQEE